MKLKIGDAVYLQKTDVAFLIYEVGAFPGSFIDELFSGRDMFFINGGIDSLKFSLRFEEPENVEWLMAQDYIPDFEILNGQTISELKKIVDALSNRSREISTEFTDMPLDYQKEHIGQFKMEQSLVAFKQVSYEKMIDYLRGKAEFTFPNGYRPVKPETKKKGWFFGLFGARK